MKAFSEHPFDPSELRLLNECRMYLRVITLSDICTADLRTITHDAMYGRTPSRFRRLEWPRRPPNLSRRHWQTWQRALHRCFIVPASARRSLRLQLGEWLPAAEKDWQWFYSKEESRLYHKEGTSFRMYARTSSTRSRPSTARYRQLPDIEWSLPIDYELATVNILDNHSLQLTATSPRPTTVTHTAPPQYHTMTIHQILASRPSDDHWAVTRVEIPNDGIHLAMGIISGQATAVSDGSYKEEAGDHYGTSAFVLRGANRSAGALGINSVPGHNHEQSSYRSELAGISGSLAIIAAVCDKYGITSGSITIALDGEQAMLNASSSWPLSPQDTDFDLLTDIRAKVAKSPIDFKWQWIKGHQDDDIHELDLSPLAQDNVLADRMAKQWLQSCINDQYTPAPQRFGDESWSLSYKGYKLSKLDYTRLYSKMWSGTAHTYWSKKHRIPPETADMIDWEVCGDALGSLPFKERRRLIKHASGHFGIGTKMRQWGFQDHDECPLCQSSETAQHVLQCPDLRAATAWSATLLKLENWMITKQTDPVICTAIIKHLQAWRDGTSPPRTATISNLAPALDSQNDIGWYPFMMGHISHHWIGTQQAYYDSLSVQHTGRQWAKQLIIKLFNTSWDMWEHRNGIKHDTITPEKIRTLRHLDDSIRAEYSVGDKGLLPRDKRWLFHPLQTVLDTYTVVSKQQWLESVANARLKWARRRELARAAQDKSRQLLRDWLDSVPSHPTPRTRPPTQHLSIRKTKHVSKPKTTKKKTTVKPPRRTRTPHRMVPPSIT